MIDTNGQLNIDASPWKMLGLGLIGAGMTALGAALAFGLLPDGPGPGSFGQFIGYAAFMFFGLCTAILLWRAFASSGPVVTITAEGIRDSRVARDVIPWTAVRDISTWTHSGQKVMVLAIDPAVENRLALTRIARMTRGANRSLGADGLCVTAQGLKTTYDDLLRASIAYAAAAQKRRADMEPVHGSG